MENILNICLFEIILSEIFLQENFAKYGSAFIECKVVLTMYSGTGLGVEQSDATEGPAKTIGPQAPSVCPTGRTGSYVGTAEDSGA